MIIFGLHLATIQIFFEKGEHSGNGIKNINEHS